MKVKCVSNNCMVGILTRGKIYVVFMEMEEYYVILDDTNQVRKVSKHYLKPVKEEKLEESENDYRIRDGYCPIFIPGRGGKNTFKKHIEKLRAINPILFSKEYLLQFGTEVNETDFPKDVKEDKTEKTRVKLMVDVKITKGEKSVDCNFTKGKIYDVENSDLYFYYTRNDLGVLYKLSKDLFEIIKEDKMENRIVRKLEDLDGLENGMGLKIEWDRNLKTIDVNFGKIKTMYWSDMDLKNFGLELVLDQIKSMGFKFEYKPLDKNEEKLEKILESVEDVEAKNNIRNIFKIQKEFFEEIRNKMLSDVKKPSKVVHEVIKEIKSLKSLTFKQGELNYFVSWCKGKYHVEAMRETFIIGANYMTEEQAQKYVTELNEIIGVGK
ncbi:DUF6501 family protein [Cetobacterium sp.]|uniref:DUF6501 family protein n=1 Tax=Cetobacterium sp. TaxID=2071632 RepID=UPI003F2E8E0A